MQSNKSVIFSGASLEEVEYVRVYMYTLHIRAYTKNVENVRMYIRHTCQCVGLDIFRRMVTILHPLNLFQVLLKPIKWSS